MTNDDVQRALRNLVAIERDRELGYRSSELHMDPIEAIEDGLKALDDDPEDIVWEEDQEKLGINL